MNRLAVVAALLFAVPADGSIARAQPAAAPAATEIYDRAQAAVRARGTPPFIAYSQYVSLARHGRTRSQNERIVVRCADGATYITALDDPHAPPRVQARPPVFPTSTFGLVPRRAGEAPSPILEGAQSDQPEVAAGPRVIGHVSATSRPYDLSLAGIESIGGAAVYHVDAVPRFDPSRNRIRALYVDTSTFEPRRIVFEYFAARGPLRSRPTVTVNYTQAGGTWVIAHAALDFVVRFGFLSYGGSGELRITDVEFPAAEPAWMFDPAALAAHRRAAGESTR